jgi:hypothetical protein
MTPPCPFNPRIQPTLYALHPGSVPPYLFPRRNPRSTEEVMPDGVFLDDDEATLAALGYKQELHRSWSGFSNFG